MRDWDKKQFHTLTAVLVIIAGGLFVFTTELAPALLGLALLLVAAVVMFLGRGRP